MNIHLTLNGVPQTVAVEPSDLLIDVVRDRLGVKSPKRGCGKGDCGSCTVLLNGRTVRSCLMLAVEADGQEITTVEGLSPRGPNALQEALIRRNAFQCGYCAPGVTLAATELLERNPHPTEHEIREAIAGNLCRCTGYEAIVEAVRDVAAARPKKAARPRKGAKR